MTTSEEHLSESRFAHLLQPIRDLAENWNIDIAKDLEEYLSELEEITFQFDGINKTLNFVEAALLIQGSACIYSKKVEYLYLLIYKTLELLVEKRKQKFHKQPSSVNEDGKDVDVECDDIEMVPLDDALEEASGIDLDEEDEQSSQTKKLDRCSLDFVRASGSLSTMNALTEDGTIDINSEFKMNSCRISNAGALILGQTLDFLTKNNNFDTTDKNMVSLNSTKINSDNLHNEEQNGMMFVEFDEHEPPPPPQTSNNNNNGGGSDNQNNLASVDNISAGTALTTTDSTNRLSNNQKKGTPKLLPSNPWETLDPHDPEDIPEKVPKKGRTWKLPSGLTLPNSKTSKDTQTTRPLLFSKMATNSLIDHPLLVDYMSANYLMGPFFVEFQYLYDVEMKKRAQEIKHAKQNRTVQTFDEVEMDPYENENDNFHDIGIDNNFDDGQQNENNLIDTVNGPIEEVNGLPNTECDQKELECGQNYEDLCRKHVENYLTASEQYIRESELSKRVQEWSEKLEPFLREQERRPIFDIRKYCEDIIEKLHQSNSDERKEQRVVSFKEIVRSKPESYDVCRIFVSCLQLANNGNLEICVEEKTETSSFNNISLRLLSEQLNFEEMESCQLYSNDSAAIWKVNRNQNEEQKKDDYDNQIQANNDQKQVTMAKGSKKKKNGDFQKKDSQKRKKKKVITKRHYSEIEQSKKENVVTENLITILKSS